MNRTIQMLKTTADDKQAMWPQRLPTVMAAYRMTAHKTTPNMAMLGREVMMPAALIARPPEEPHRTTVPFVRDLRDTLRDAHQWVQDASRSSARTQKQYYDERLRQTVFIEGQLVWRIESFKSPLVMVLKHTAKCTRQTVHGDRLLPYNSPPPAVPEADSGIPPDSQTPTDGQDIPDGDSQPLLGLEEDSQSWGNSESQTQSASV